MLSLLSTLWLQGEVGVRVREKQLPVVAVVQVVYWLLLQP
jgi:hypothetical protein